MGTVFTHWSHKIKGARVTITPNIESESGWKVESITFELKGYENM